MKLRQFCWQALGWVVALVSIAAIALVVPRELRLPLPPGPWVEWIDKYLPKVPDPAPLAEPAPPAAEPVSDPDASVPAPAEPVAATPQEVVEPHPFGRGVNLGNALDAPNEGDWGVTLKPEYFDAIKSAGFESVRLPVRWSAHADPQPPYTIDPRFLARVDWALDQALGRRLQIVLNVHHYEELIHEPDAHRARFLGLWKQIAEHYRTSGPALAFELLNEPGHELTAARWNPLLVEALKIVRSSNPTRRVVVGPAGFNSIGELPNLILPEDDRHLVVTVHYYLPFAFTHQGAVWAGPESQQWLGTRWLGSAAEVGAVQADFDKAAGWARARRRPLYLGEFGAFEKADMPSRARWARCVMETAWQRQMGTAWWEFCSTFGLYDAAQRRWIEPLREALFEGAENRGP